MKRMLIGFILIIFLIVGCEKIGDMVIINTNRIKCDDLQQIGGMLQNKGFKTVVWERKKDIPRHSGELYTLFKKKTER